MMMGNVILTQNVQILQVYAANLSQALEGGSGIHQCHRNARNQFLIFLGKKNLLATILQIDADQD